MSIRYTVTGFEPTTFFLIVLLSYFADKYFKIRPIQ